MIRESSVQYVAAVYGVTWIAVIAYIGILYSKLGRMERRLDEIAELLEGGADG